MNNMKNDPIPGYTYIYVHNLNVTLLHGNIDQTLVNTVHGLLNCKISGLDSHVITAEYRT